MLNSPHIKDVWAQAVPADQWRTYAHAIRALQAAEVRFMLGGAFALACYTGRWRNTKDLDLYIHRADRDRAVDTLSSVGFKDLFDHVAYDCRWIYRSTRDGLIVDLIWAMANQRAQLEWSWFDRAPNVLLHGQQVAVLPAEELLWCKLYVFQRSRCDWPDLLNLLYACGPQLDWNRLIDHLGPDRLLLSALITVFTWLCPERAQHLPSSVQTALCSPPIGSVPMEDRIKLIDSRLWFVAHAPEDKPLDADPV